MGNWEKFKQVIGIPDGSEIIEGGGTSEGTAETAPIRDTSTSVKKESARTSAVRPSAARSQVNMVIIRSSDYADARTVADHILANRAVLLNLENCNKEMAQRILDFLSGVVYAQGGDLQRVAHSTYAVTPRNVGLQGELSDEMREEEY